MDQTELLSATEVERIQAMVTGAENCPGSQWSEEVKYLGALLVRVANTAKASNDAMTRTVTLLRRLVKEFI